MRGTVPSYRMLSTRELARFARNARQPAKDFYPVVDAAPAEMDKVGGKFSNPFVIVYYGDKFNKAL